ncbi:hypothetical protein BHU09_09995 [Tannerella sp. oral taxon 808]|nr:hypothetical protein BHU09_09995 [Tannerella sp. oral taxon 808]
MITKMRFCYYPRQGLRRRTASGLLPAPRTAPGLVLILGLFGRLGGHMDVVATAGLLGLLGLLGVGRLLRLFGLLGLLGFLRFFRLLGLLRGRGALLGGALSVGRVELGGALVEPVG